MKRNFDMIRDFLFKIEGAERNGRGSLSDYDLFGPDRVGPHTERKKHLRLMLDAGLFDGADLGDTFTVHRTSRKGRELTDIIRNDDAYEKAKAATQDVEGISMTLFAEVAVAIQAQSIERKTGLKLGSSQTPNI